MSTFVVMIDRIFLVQQSREDVFPGRNDGGHGAISPVVAMALPPTLFEKFLPTPAKGCQISGPAWAPELAVTDPTGTGQVASTLVLSRMMSRKPCNHDASKRPPIHLIVHHLYWTIFALWFQALRMSIDSRKHCSGAHRVSGRGGRQRASAVSSFGTRFQAQQHELSPWISKLGTGVGR